MQLGIKPKALIGSSTEADTETNFLTIAQAVQGSMLRSVKKSSEITKAAQ
uniref:Uncharacterized protein n=1 Tax=Rhizophora mucronata TaxID=61149 RepID=A0A2P2IHH1_RHIMU